MTQSMQVDIQSYQDLGQTLYNVRVSMQLELRDIAQRLHIRAKYLAALEEGNLDVIPGKVYARGYLRQYSEFLGLDPEEATEAFDRVATARNVKYFVPEPTSRAYQPGFIVVAIALAGLFIAYMYWYRTHKSIELPPSHELVAPVPERLLAPVVDGPVIDEPEQPLSDVLEEQAPYTEPSPVRVPEEENNPPVVPTAYPPQNVTPAAPTPSPSPATGQPAPAAPLSRERNPDSGITPVDASKALPWHRPQNREGRQ